MTTKPRGAGVAGRRRHAATGATYLERVNLAIDDILAHLNRPARLARLARIAMLSPFHFHRVFQAMVGETPSDFSKRLRLEKAIGLMAHGRRRSLTEIAFDCGFGSSSDFSRAFRQRYGVPPRAFDVEVWRARQGEALQSLAAHPARLAKLPPRANPDGFTVRLRDIPARTVAYIRVDNPYQGDAVIQAASRLMSWAETNGLANGQWLGYQWENPEITELGLCRYFVAVEVPTGRGRASFTPRGEIGRFRFPAMQVAQVDVDGGIDLELKALYWLYGSWLPRSRFVPDDHPCFEAWAGRPFGHGMGRFELGVQLPVRER